jgi:hypothetical protein
MTDERLRELYRQALARSDGGGRERCVAPEAMLALLRREGPEEQRLQTLDHVMACGACRREMDLLRSIEQAGAETQQAAVVRPLRRPALKMLVPLALAASGSGSGSSDPKRPMSCAERGMRSRCSRRRPT